MTLSQANITSSNDSTPTLDQLETQVEKTENKTTIPEAEVKEDESKET